MTPPPFAPPGPTLDRFATITLLTHCCYARLMIRVPASASAAAGDAAADVALVLHARLCGAVAEPSRR